MFPQYSVRVYAKPWQFKDSAAKTSTDNREFALSNFEPETRNPSLRSPAVS